MADGELVFSGLKVLDLASFIAGPAAATILGDFGADVIKIEAPGGDPYRALDKAPGMPVADIDYHWQLDNRNKRSLMLNLRDPDGRAVLDKLLVDTDVVVTNFVPAIRQRLGIGYEDVAKINPRIIYAVITGYGENGAEADKPGFDSSALWARSGLMDVVKPDPEGAPARSAPGQGDHPTAVSLFAAIATALYQRERSGKGMQVDTSLLANGIWSNAYFAQAALCGSEIPRRPHRDRFPNAMTNHFKCRDGHWFILSMVNEDKQWDAFCQAVGRPELRTDPRFAVKTDRHANSVALIEILDDVFMQKDWTEWQKVLDEYRITFGVISRMSDLSDDRQLIDSGTIVPGEGLGGKDRHAIDSPLWLRGFPKRPAGPAPTIGQHHIDILTEAGLSEAEIKALKAKGAVG